MLDGAHTPAAAAALVETLGEAFPKLPVAFIVAMADDKDHAGRVLRRLTIFTSCLRVHAGLSFPQGKLARNAHTDAASQVSWRP